MLGASDTCTSYQSYVMYIFSFDITSFLDFCKKDPQRIPGDPVISQKVSGAESHTLHDSELDGESMEAIDVVNDLDFSSNANPQKKSKENPVSVS